MLEHIRVIADEIGPRLAGSEGEQAAVDYAREQFERFGYDVEVQPFTVDGPDSLRPATLVAGAVGEIVAITLQGSASDTVAGPLVDVGTGEADDVPPALDGAIALAQRLDVPFVDMATRAKEAGAIGLVIANKEPGLFLGRIEPPTDLPVVAIDQADGETLRGALDDGAVTVDLAVDELRDVTAFNVVARPPSGECRTVSGGHYDSVPWADGANDNASGSALVLELARMAAVRGLAGHCFALWGAEELGLLGSEFFALGLSQAQRQALDAYYNYDVVGGNEPPLAAGNPDLIERAGELSSSELDTSVDVREISSDHLNFLDFGVPSLMLTTPSFDLIHTPADTLENLEPAFMVELAALGLALLAEDGPG